jgi:putative acetyltransferase
MISRRSGLGTAIRLESPRQEDVMRLLAALDAYLGSLYPPESNHILDIDTLCAPDIRFFVARREGEAVGCGALRIDSTGYGEVKRMFVHPGARGQKLGRAILKRIEDEASREGLALLRLETGIHQAAALALYRNAGYAERGPFGGYAPDPLSHFFERNIDPGSKRRAARGR